MSKQFSKEEVIAYYDQTEVHYRLFWQLEKSMGLHYGIWEKGVKGLPEAIINTNRKLAALSNISDKDLVLDAGCGIGGSSFFLHQNYGCHTEGITLSAKQVETATDKAKKLGIHEAVNFSAQDYTQSNFPDMHFDKVWAIESMETASDKSAFFKEANRILKPGGHLLIGDIFKPFPFPIEKEPKMQKWLNAWAMSDILTIKELKGLAKEYGFTIKKQVNVNKQVWPSVWRIYVAGLLGFIGTTWYNFFHDGSYFGRIHYSSGINQFHCYRKGLWEYHLWVLEKQM